LKVHNYKTSGGKDLIYNYIDKLSADEKADGYSVIEKIVDDKMDELRIEHWQGKIYEIYFHKHNRIFYVASDDINIYLLHACRKQKNKTERKDSKIVIKRARELGEQLSKKFI